MNQTGTFKMTEIQPIKLLKPISSAKLPHMAST